jgi:hypothetical protein
MNKSGTLGIIIILSVAILGSIIVDLYDAQHLEAAKSDIEFLWCYSTPISPNDFLCYTNHEECSMIQSVDDDAKSDCLRKKNGS